MSKLMWLGIAALMAGMLSGVLEKTMYGFVDENNILQESFFLPLAFILSFLGGGLIIVAIAGNLSKRFRSPNN